MSGAVLLVGALAVLAQAPCARCSPRPAPAPAPLQVTSSAAGTALYRAPSSYREPGRPTRNSVIITSQPVRIGQQLDLDAAASSAAAQSQPPPPPPAESIAAPPTWRRQLFVRTTLGTDGAQWMPAVHVTSSSTALGVGGSGGALTASDAGGTPTVNIDCADGKSCSTTIPVRPPAATHSPTFKPYSQEVLDKFLSDYATVTTAGNGTDPVGGKELLLQLQQQQRQQQQQQGPGGETPPGQSADGIELEPTNRLANLYLEDGGGDGPGAENSTDDKSKSVQWSLLKSQHHKHPYDDHKGWVTLEPVPWSSSHVSKWQSNVQPGRPWDNSPSPSTWHNDIDQRPAGPSGPFPPPHHGPGPGHGQGQGQGPNHGPNSGYHHGQSTQNFNGNGDWPSGGGGGGPPRPSASWSNGPGWDQDRPGPGDSYRPDRPSPVSRPPPASWDSNRPNKWDRPSPAASEQWVSSADPDIITDNSPPDFPAHPGAQQGLQGLSRPGGGYSYGPGGGGQGGPSGPAGPGRPWGGNQPHREPSRHPPTHPEEGDGTWVLLSSTKGYSTPPRGRLPHQRALTVSTHRSVRLTVLPPENGTNMTTSHGGLLEVEDTHHTVDESQRLHAASLLKQALDQHHNATLSSYESLVREAARVHEAQLLKQALADRRLANATALSADILQQAQAQAQADRRADNMTVVPAVAAAPAAVAAVAAAVPAKTKKSRTKIRIEPQPQPQPQKSADSPNFTGRGEGSGMALKVVRPATPSRRSMALAAVGAGLLPATMAMLVPIMLGRRRRSAPEDDMETRTKVDVAPSSAYTAYAPVDQPLEAEDSPPRVIDFAPSSSSSWPRLRRRRTLWGSRI